MLVVEVTSFLCNFTALMMLQVAGFVHVLMQIVHCIW